MRFPAKITSRCIWVAISKSIDWVILHWYALGADGRANGCTVSWLSKFHRWVDYHIVLGTGTIISRVRAEWGIWVGYNHLISNKYVWNNCFVKNAHKMSRILPEFICKNNRFSAAYSCHIWRAWYNGSYTIMAKPIRASELRIMKIISRWCSTMRS